MGDSVSDDSSPENVIPPVEDNVLKVMDERSQQLAMLNAFFALPQYNVDDVIPESFVTVTTTSPVQYFSGEDINMPGCSHWGSDMPFQTTATTNLLPPEVSPITCSCNKNPQTYQSPMLIIISTTLYSVPDNPSFWRNKKRFPSSRGAYICRMPKLLLTNGIIYQTLRFIPDKTICDFRMKLQLVYKGRVLDQWLFEKGLVRRQVVTVWETTITRTPDLDYFSDLTTYAILKTKFYDGEQLLHKYKARIIFT